MNQSDEWFAGRSNQHCIRGGNADKVFDFSIHDGSKTSRELACDAEEKPLCRVPSSASTASESTSATWTATSFSEDSYCDEVDWVDPVWCRGRADESLEQLANSVEMPPWNGIDRAVHETPPAPDEDENPVDAVNLDSNTVILVQILFSFLVGAAVLKVLRSCGLAVDVAIGTNNPVAAPLSNPATHFEYSLSAVMHDLRCAVHFALGVVLCCVMQQNADRRRTSQRGNLVIDRPWPKQGFSSWMLL